jgi:GT2 family glycosyltransferase
LVLLNQDTLVLEGWLEGLMRACQGPRIGVVGCKALYPDRETIQHAGGRIEWPLGMSAHLGAGQPDAEEWNRAGPVDYVSGASMAFRRDVLDRVGLLDERFHPGYYEDADLCLRARDAGYEVWYTPDACLIHNESTALSGRPALHVAVNRGRLLFVLKHLPPSRFVAEFAPAERAWLLPLAGSEFAQVMRRLYLETIPVAAVILARRWRSEATEVRQVLHALLQLYQDAPEELPPVEPVLREFEFKSSVPLVGPLFAGLRSLWYSVAARWAVRHLEQQQQAVNRAYLRRIEQQEAANAHATHSLVSLSQELARVIQALDSGKRSHE